MLPNESNSIYFDYKNLDELNTDVDAINNSIQNILLTRRGSLPGKPTFGSDLYQVLFEHIDHITEDLIKTYVIKALSEWEPRIHLKKVYINEYPEYNKIVINIEYFFIYYEKRIDANASITVFR